MSVIVECEHLTKSYGDLIAVNDVSFSVEEGEIFGLVGPNGAGKTTLIEMIEGLRTPDSGLIKALGLDPTKQSDELKEKIGVLLQTTSIQPDIKVKGSLKQRGIYLSIVPTLPLLLQMLWTAKIGSKKAIFMILKPSTKDLIFLRELIEAGEIRVVIDRTYPLQ